MTVTTAEVRSGLEAGGWRLATYQIDRLTRYLNLLERWNRVQNLTGIKLPGELIDRHLRESLALGPLLNGARIADIGTGAGLPGVPLAICYPERTFTLVESRRKRVSFLRHVAAELDLGNTEIAHSRAEDLPTQAPFATVLARAVAPPAELLAITRPLTAAGSILLVLTSAERGRGFAGLADDFVERSPGDLKTAPLQSSIVMLERVAGPEIGAS